MKRFLAIALCAFAGFAVAGTAFAGGIEVTPLTAADVPVLLKPPAHGERIIMLWALDCAYCEPNMEALAKLQRARPGRIELVTVDTDDVALHAAAIAKRLAAAGMHGYAARAYASAAPDRLNYLIDPTWGGELPRTLVIRADGTSTAISGELTADQLKKIEP